MSVDITQFVNKVGDHSIRVKATNPQNPNIADSPFAFIGTSTEEKLSKVELDDGKGNGGLKATISEVVKDNNQTTASIAVDWKGVQNGYEYKIELKVGAAKYEIGRTSVSNSGNVGYSIDFEALTKLYSITYDRSVAQSGGYEIVVTAIGHGYFTNSDSASCKATLSQAPTTTETGAGRIATSMSKQAA